MTNGEEQDNPRRTIITALVVAVILAAGLWYFLVFRPTGSEEAPTDVAVIDQLPGETPEDVTSTFEDIVGTTPAPVSQVAGDVLFEQPEDAGVPTTSPTGAAEWLLAAAFATAIGGFVGLRKMSLRR